MTTVVADEASLLAADDRRYAVLLAGDADALADLLDDNFVYIHSTGREESKDSFVESIRSGRVDYHRVELLDRWTWMHGNVGMLRGHVDLHLEIEGEARLLNLVFLAVWSLVDGRWQMRNWTSVPARNRMRPQPEHPPLSDETRDTLGRVGTPAIVNALLTHGIRRPMLRDVRPLRNEQSPMVGPAYTLRFIPAREDLDSMEQYAQPSNRHRRAIEECPTGSVLVIDANGSTEVSSMGDIMARRLRHRGVAGVVTDGGFRDTAGVAATGIPAFQRGNAAPPTPNALHAVGLDEPVGCGGVAVYPGDVVVGDVDGVVVIPRHLVEEVASAAAAAADYESFAEREIDRGRSILEVLPATDASRAEFEQWVAAGRPEKEST